MSDSFDSKSLGLRAQKKLLGKMASKNFAKVFIDETSGRLLDNVYRLTRDYSGSKKVAEKQLKYLIKTVIKIGILYRNDQFSKEEIALAEDFKKKFRTVAMTVISFHDLDFSFDRNFIMKNLNECSVMLKKLVEKHLTDKSLARIDTVFQFFTDPEFLDTIFKPNGPHRGVMDKIVEDLNKLLESGTL